MGDWEMSRSDKSGNFGYKTNAYLHMKRSCRRVGAKADVNN